MKKALFFVTICLLQGVLFGQATEYRIHFSENFPLKGKSTTIKVLKGDLPVPGAGVEVIYRPNSQTVIREELGVTDSLGTVSWIPRDAGIVTVEINNRLNGEILVKENVAVRFGKFPSSGIFIICLAGFVLFGGMITSFRLLFKK